MFLACGGRLGNEGFECLLGRSLTRLFFAFTCSTTIYFLFYQGCHLELFLVIGSGLVHQLIRNQHTKVLLDIFL